MLKHVIIHGTAHGWTADSALQVALIERRLQALQDLGLCAEAIAGMLSRMPSLLGYQSRHLQAMGEYLTGLGGLTKADVALLLQKEPRILSYSFEGAPLPAALLDMLSCSQL